MNYTCRKSSKIIVCLTRELENKYVTNILRNKLHFLCVFIPFNQKKLFFGLLTALNQARLVPNVINSIIWCLHRISFEFLLWFQDLNDVQHRFDADVYVQRSVCRRHIINTNPNHCSDSEWKITDSIEQINICSPVVLWANIFYLFTHSGNTRFWILSVQISSLDITNRAEEFEVWRPFCRETTIKDVATAKMITKRCK